LKRKKIKRKKVKKVKREKREKRTRVRKKDTNGKKNFAAIYMSFWWEFMWELICLSKT